MEKAKTKRRKTILLVLLLIPAALALVLGGAYLYADNKPDIRQGYEKSIQTGGEIEAKYMANGPYEVSMHEDTVLLEFGKFIVYYPTELESTLLFWKAVKLV